MRISIAYYLCDVDIYLFVCVFNMFLAKSCNKVAIRVSLMGENQALDFRYEIA